MRKKKVETTPHCNTIPVMVPYIDFHFELILRHFCDTDKKNLIRSQCLNNFWKFSSCHSAFEKKKKSTQLASLQVASFGLIISGCHLSIKGDMLCYSRSTIK